MYLDIFIIVVALYALWRGWSNGLLKELISTLGFIIGLVVACMFYGTLGEYLTVSGSEVNIVTSIAAFLILWIMVPIVLGMVATFITKALDTSTFLSFPNKLGGGIVSILKYMLLLSCILSVMGLLGILSQERKDGSVLYGVVTAPMGILKDNVVQSFSADEKQNEVAPDTVWIPVNNK